MSTPVLTLVKPVSSDLSLPADQADLLEQIIAGYWARRCGAKNYKESSVEGDLVVVSDLIHHSGKAPWFWEEADFEGWCLSLGTERDLAVASQRKYQLAIKTFLDYLCTTQAFVNTIHTQYGIRPRQICHSGNMIPHVLDRELASPREMMSKAQLERMLLAVGEAIDIAENFRSKSYHPLRRDYAMFAIMYHLGLRASEARHLDIDHFVFDGGSGCAFANVTGKGSRGSGPKHRNVPILSPQAAKLIVWYIEEVRPSLTNPKHANERAMFLSERGSRISRGSIGNRFRNALTLAGMDLLELTPHSMRHGSITNIQMEGLSTEASRRFAGHEHASTTQRYTHVGDDFVLDQFQQFIRRNSGGPR